MQFNQSTDEVEYIFLFYLNVVLQDLQKDVAELSAYLHSANDMRESLAGNQQKELECREELEEVELSIDRTSEKVVILNIKRLFQCHVRFCFIVRCHQATSPEN